VTPRAKRALGQNFLVDANLQRKIVDELGAGPDDVVLEVGPGHGELSAHLVGRVHRAVLVEKDRDLAAALRARWGAETGVEIVEGDALALDLSRWIEPGRDLRVLSNVPYNVTSPLIFAFLGIRPSPRRIVVTVQREVAERVVAPPGSRTYGALSVGVQAVAGVRVAFQIGRRAFRPVPDVTSSVLRIEPDRYRVESLDLAALRTVTRVLFGRRRKQLQKILRTAPEFQGRGDPAAILSSLGLSPAARPETLSGAQFIALADALFGRTGGSSVEGR